MQSIKKLDVLGLPIVDHCNLNCKGCYHFCTQGQKPSFRSLDVFSRDVKRFKELVNHIDWIKLYGGEPLLHPQLKECVYLLRQIYPYSEICLMTNGLLIKSLDKETLNVLKETEIKMDITVYPILEKKLSEVISVLQDNNIRININHVSEFGRRFNKKGDSNSKAVYRNCEMKICHYLQDGEFTMCPLPIFIRRYNELFGTDYDMSGDIINIYDPKISYEDLISFANRCHDCCKYCGETELFPWSVGEANPPSSDWELEGMGDELNK